MQFICLDNDYFPTLRAKGGVYVDKTKQIYDLFSEHTYYFLSRPRRFGKSLLCSTLAELFKGNRALFKNTWIDSSDWNWEKTHPVLHFNMTNAVSMSGNASEVRQGMIQMLRGYAETFGLTDINEDHPRLMLTQLIEKIHAKMGKQVVVIIDEYDKPLLDVIDKHDKYPAIHDELRSFYTPLKTLSEHLRLVFLTGVFKFAKTSIFSGLNNLADLTFDPKAADVVGYTEAEMRLYFAEHLAALAGVYKTSVDEMMLILQKKYNGYKFGLNVATEEIFGGVYNSFAMNYVFAKQQLLDKWFASGSPTALLKQLADEQFTDLTPENLTLKFTALDNSCGVEEMGCLFMLYYAGYLSIQSFSKGKVSLGFPNLEVSQAFSSMLLPLLLEKTMSTTDRISDKLHDVFVEERLADLQELLNDALAPVSYHVLKNPNKKTYAPVPQENLYQIAFFYLFIGSNLKAVMEDATIRGRIDISIELPTIVYLLEFKVGDTAAVAIQQIKDKDYARKFKQQNRKIYAVGVSLHAKDRVVQEVAWELL